MRPAWFAAAISAGDQSGLWTAAVGAHGFSWVEGQRTSSQTGPASTPSVGAPEDSSADSQEPLRIRWHHAGVTGERLLLVHGDALVPPADPRDELATDRGVRADEEVDVVAIEPGLWDKRIGGVRLEDLLLVTADGCETLTDYPYALTPRA